MNQLNPHKVGLALGTVTGGLHVLWSVLVFIGWAQPLLDFIFSAHMVKPVLVVESFSFTLAGMLIIITAAVGYMIGQIFARAWNALRE